MFYDFPIQMNIEKTLKRWKDEKKKANIPRKRSQWANLSNQPKNLDVCGGVIMLHEYKEEEEIEGDIGINKFSNLYSVIRFMKVIVKMTCSDIGFY